MGGSRSSDKILGVLRYSSRVFLVDADLGVGACGWVTGYVG